MGWTHQRCKKETGMDGLIVIYDYRDERVKAVIDGVKFDFNKRLIKSALKNFRFETGEKFDFLVPVPLPRWLDKKRGWKFVVS